MKYSVLKVVLFYALLAQHSFATELLNSWPEAGSILERPLRSLHLTFDQTPDAQNAEIRINGADSNITVRALHGMGSNDLMALVNGAMPDGDYVLSWKVADYRGEVPFSVKRAEGYVEDRWELPLDIGVVLYDGAEPLDVFGPLEIWMNAGPDNVRVHLIAETRGPVTMTTTGYPKQLAPQVIAQYSFEDYPDLDVLMVPGGVGTLVEVENPEMIKFLQKATADVAVASSVCTGSGLLARAGLLNGVDATGNKAFFDYLVAQGDANWIPEARWVESGRFFTSSGVSAGIDMSLAVIARFFGQVSARMIAASTEYVWNEDPTLDPFIGILNSAVPYVDTIKRRFESQAEENSTNPLGRTQ